MGREVEIPDLSSCVSVWRKLAVRQMLSGSVINHNPVTKGLVTNFIRLAETAISQYEAGRKAICEYYETQDGSLLNAMLIASGSFESCVTNVHRALEHLEALRRNPEVPTEIKSCIPRTVMALREMGRIRDMRHAIQHNDERIKNGVVKEGEPFMLKVDGDSDGEAKKLNRLQLGSMQINFSDLSDWLKELHGITQKMIL